MLTKETVAQITKDFGRKEGDTGSVEVQVALLTHQINSLT
ncbi:MAG: 30S ribosomal protein S15, partial [Solobacterium sp.]|nr:30S ribosomal protein S15 [Solobacterium sp.]